jgi:propanol-preferring alcohol dehydrogenase
MHAMILETVGTPLRQTEMPSPEPAQGQIKARVLACAICRTDRHVIDGELPNPKLPLVPGHEIVGRVVECGPGVTGLDIGTRVGIPWLGHTCGECLYCRSGEENLCDRPRFTGYTLDGGYAEFVVAEASFCFPIPDLYSDVEAAPLLCAGLIGYRSLVKAGSDAKRLGIYGFGAAAHIVTQVAKFEGREIYAFTRARATRGQEFALGLGATWAGDSDQLPPVQLDAAIIFAPVGSLVPVALQAVRKGGRVVCGGIHMSDIPTFPYAWLWEERSICSVANLTRSDARSFLDLAAKTKIRTETVVFPMSRANVALDNLRNGQVQGAAVLVPYW